MRNIIKSRRAVRILAILLCFIMVLSIIPIVAYADLFSIQEPEHTIYYDQRNERISAFLDEVEYEPDDKNTKIKEYVAPGEKLDYPYGFPVSVKEGDILFIKDETENIGIRRIDITEDNDSYIIYNLVPYHTYLVSVLTGRTIVRYRVVPTGNVRYIFSPKIDNLRDCGGWKLENGGIFRYGVLYRGAAIPGRMSEAIDADLNTLEELGVTIEVDLRDGSEIADTLAVHEALFGEGNSQIKGAKYFQNSGSYYAEALNPQNKSAYNTTIVSLRLIMDSVLQGHTVFFHCAVGADRTGTIAFLIEGLAGVSESDLDKDYELTSFAFQNAYRQISADNYWKMRDRIKKWEGDTLQQKFYNWFLDAGFTEDELDKFIEIVTDKESNASTEGTDEVVIMKGKNDVPVISEDPEDLNLFVGNDQVGDACFTSLGFDTSASDRYAKAVSEGADRLDEMGIRLFSIPCPTSVGLLSDYYREKLGSADQGEILRYIADKTNDTVYNVNIYPILREHDKEYLYFRTDHHWTALAAYYAYVEFCRTAGIDAASLDEFEEVNEGEFTGTYYPIAAKRELLQIDTLYAYKPIGKYNMQVKYTSGSRVHEYDNPIVDYSQKNRYEKYNSFILGDNYYVDIENKDLPEDAPSCAVIKDSFGDPFSVYLTQNYKHVYVLDYRHFKTPVREFAEKTKIDDVIICQSIGVSQTFGPISILEARLR